MKTEFVATTLILNDNKVGEVWTTTSEGEGWRNCLKFQGDKGIDFYINNTLFIIHYCADRGEWIILVKNK